MYWAMCEGYPNPSTRVGEKYERVLEPTMTMYPATNSHVRQFRTERPSAWMDVRRGVSCVRLWTLSDSRREMAISRSRGDRRLVFAGKSGRMKNETIDQPTVAAPSTMNNHRQPSIPCAPFRSPVIAPAMMPPKAPESTAAEM